MGETTKISWTEHTVNFWVGCRAVSEGCDRCYAKVLVEKWGGDFANVHKTKTWNDPIKWQKEAAKLGAHVMVFTCSLSDFFIQDADPWRPDVWKIIHDTPNLMYQILTKRPDLVAKRLPADWGTGYPNVWLGVSVESKAFLKRMDVLRDIPARVRFVSAEPLLEDICPELKSHVKGFHQIIVGGESGNNSKNFRPMDPQWARNILKVCRAKGVAFFFKQSSAVRTEMGTNLDGIEYHEYPDIPELAGRSTASAVKLF